MRLYLYLDASTRVFRAVGPPGAPLPAALTANTVIFEVSDEDWQNVYHPASQTAQDAGQDLVVNNDGSTSGAAHVATPREQAFAVLAAYLANASPTGAETVQALKMTIRILRALL